MKKEIWMPLMIGLFMMAGLSYASVSMPIVLVFIPALIVAFFIYLSTAYKKAPEPETILPIYLLALGVQCLHFAEEYITGFNVKIPEMLGLPALPLNDWVIFNMVAYCLFIIGGIAFSRKKKEFMIIPLFFIIAGVFFNTVVHILTSLWQMKYMPGLITVFLYIPLLPRFVKALKNSEQVEPVV